MKKILTIAGSDSIGGAGIQADIKTITAHKMYAMSAITSLTAQNTNGVFGVVDTKPDFIKAQIDAICDDIKPDATKIGMLSNEDIMIVIKESIKKHSIKNIVLDPVMVATSGGILMQTSAINTLKNELFPLAYLITPNILEAEVLAQIKIQNTKDMQKAAYKLADFGSKAVLIKGGHLEKQAVDILLYEGKIYKFKSKRIRTKNTHGTGCTLSSAIACGLANNLELHEAVKLAKKFVFKALSWKQQIGHGNGAINHYFRIKKFS